MIGLANDYMTVSITSYTAWALPNERLLPAGEAPQEEGIRAHRDKLRRCESSMTPTCPLISPDLQHARQLNIEVHCDIVPKTGENFIGLCSKGCERYWGVVRLHPCSCVCILLS